MTVIAQSGVFAWGIQNYKSTHASYAAVANSAFRKHKAQEVALGAVQNSQIMPLEVGGGITPTGAYKSMAYVAGGATILPRLEGHYGELLKATLGDVSTVGATFNSELLMTNTALTGSPQTNVAGLVLPGRTPAAGIGRMLVVKLICTGTGVFAGSTDIVVDNTVAGGSDTETFECDGLGQGVHYLRGIAGNVVFDYDKAVQIDLPAAPANLAVKVSVGVIDDNTILAKEHRFRFAAQPEALPWLTLRSVTPGPTTAEYMGFQGVDGKIMGHRLTFPQNGLVNARLDFLGRIPTLVDDPYNMTNWGTDFTGLTFEDYLSVPITCVVEGGIIIPGYSSAEVPMTALVVNMANNTTQPQQEMIIGSYHPDDYATLNRALTFQATYKWADSKMYRYILNNSLTAQGWSPEPWISPLVAKTGSPGAITDATKWGLEVYCPSVVWSVDGPPTLAGGDMVQLKLTGQVLEPLGYAKVAPKVAGAANGVYPFADFRLTNAVQSY